MTIATFVLALLAAMALGAPIAFSLLICGVAMMVQMGNFDSQIVAQNLLEGANNYPLMAVPFFMLTGELMNAGGLSQRIVDVADALVGHVRGGLGYVAIIAAAIVASISGSAVADTAAVAALLIPMMRNANYNVPRSAGLIASAGCIAPVVPPSIPIVIFGVTAQLSITKLFLAGIFPGLMMAMILAATWWLVARKDFKDAPPRTMDFARLRKALRDGVWALVLPVVIIGGMKAGVFTPTEAASVAVFYSLFAGLLIYRELKLTMIPRVLVAAVRTSATIMFLVASAMVSAWLITVADIPAQVVVLLQPFMDNPITLMFVITLLVIVIGTALDLMPTVLILGPILVPVVKQAGIDPIYFGVIFIMNNAIGLLTPPVGNVLNVVAGVSKESLDDVIKGVWPFLIAETALMFLLVFFPSLVLVPMKWLS
ncbi:TRAP transporter large permease subunit [Propionivibrio dicarboxylicus]|uniref:TRAP transporter large permease protein n=1 Tax=Propionivibrio dicarboxylicus TaxID=83767 RepID=A0A1G8AMV4_9RHOO|nr:TRAP transporter large permease subunit [Propionivibrio dicarboxylicus]SDH22247.1 TRAP transporter, DctM subunit [Propionivibrio dicarboxylicus]